MNRSKKYLIEGEVRTDGDRPMYSIRTRKLIMDEIKKIAYEKGISKDSLLELIMVDYCISNGSDFVKVDNCI